MQLYSILLMVLAGPVFTLANEAINSAERNVLKRSITPDNSCGGTVNGYTCNPNDARGGPCCSQNGFCGSSAAYCSAGCQWNFSNPGCSYSSQNTCGGTQGFTCKPDSPGGGPCCSSHGYCGISAAYCGTGCQSQYGTCFGVSPPAIKHGTTYEVPNVGVFTTFKNYTFNVNNQVPSGLTATNAPNDVIPAPGANYSHVYIGSNVQVTGGFMILKVPGGQTSKPYTGAEVTTNDRNILYASVRTYAIFSGVPGTVNGQFFFHNNSQEIDIEYLTDPKSHSNVNGVIEMQYTNQAVNSSTPETFQRAPAPADAASAIHEYRVDWIKGKNMFYLDGVLQETFTTNVPSVPGLWDWNNWCDGNIGFTAGPPAQDNLFKIKNIVMYYNTSTT